MSKSVLDASALLALLNEEPGAEKVAQAVSQGALVSTVNLSEVVGKLCEAGMPENGALPGAIAGHYFARCHPLLGCNQRWSHRITRTRRESASEQPEVEDL